MGKDFSPTISSSEAEETTPIVGEKVRRIVPVEPVYFLYFLSILSAVPVIQQFLYYYISKSYGLPGVSFGNESLCHQVNNSKSALELKAQQESSDWMMYLSLANSIPALIVIPMFGAFCDRVGRKLTMLITIVGHVLYLINCLVVVYGDYHIKYLLIGSLVLGLFGFYGAIGIGANAYIADTVPPSELSFRLAALGAATGLAGIASNIGMGYWIRLSGSFFYPLLLPLGVQLLCMLYVMILIPETLKVNAQRETLSSTLITYLTKMFKLYIVGENTSVLCVVMIGFVLTAIVDDSKMNVQSLFQMKQPLCWNSIQIGYFNAITSFTFCVLTMVAIKILSRWLRDVHMALLACVFKTASLVLQAFATTDVLMYLVPVVACFAFVAPLQKSMLSKLVSPTEQGAVMSSVAFAETLCVLLGSLLFNNIYNATLAFLPGFVFLFMAALVILGTIFLLIFWRMEKKRALYQPISKYEVTD